MASYDLKFLNDFSIRCQEMESTKHRTEDVDQVLRFIHKIYDKTLSGELPTRCGYLTQNGHINEVPENRQQESQVDSELSLQNVREKKHISEVLELFLNEVFQKCTNALSGTNFGYIPNSTTYASVLGGTLAVHIPINATVYSLAPGACELEFSVVKWLCSVVGYGEKSCGYLTSGSSSATVHAFMVARDELLKSTELYDRCVVYTSDCSHNSNWKALNVVGLGRCHVREIPTDGDYRMDVCSLEEEIEKDIEANRIPFMVVGSAGTTESGAIDPLMSIANIARNYKLWFHVDAAIGGVCMLSARVKSMMGGIELSDSVSVDCHKLLFQPPVLGAILVRQGEKLKTCMSMKEPSFLREDDNQYSPRDYTFELSRPMRGLPLWFSLNLLGGDFFRNVIDEKIQLTQYFVDQLKKIPYVVICNKPDLMIVLFRYEPPRKNLEEINTRFEEKLVNEKAIFASTIVFKGIRYHRVCLSAFRTHIQEANLLVKTIKRITLELSYKKQRV